MHFDAAAAVQDYLVFGEFGEVNPSITDSSTFTFLSPEKMEEVFSHEIEGCFLYSRHWNPVNTYLSEALARLETAEAAQVMVSGAEIPEAEQKQLGLGPGLVRLSVGLDNDIQRSFARMLKCLEQW